MWLAAWRFDLGSRMCRVSRRSFALFLGLACAGCKCGDRPPTKDVGAVCSRACANLIGAGCDAGGFSPEHQPRCIADCVKQTHDIVNSGCTELRFAYLECAATTQVECSDARSGAAQS